MASEGFWESELPVAWTPQAKYAALTIMFNPIFWNIAAQIELRTKFLTKLAGDRYRGCYLLAVTIFLLGIYRDVVFERALRAQPVSPLLAQSLLPYMGYIICACGYTLVLSSMWALGVTGTYLGDYFGILMDHRVTSFPFNVVENPMYVGSFLGFFGTSLIYSRVLGLMLSGLVWLMYSIALRLEGPFTARIYAERDANKKID